MCNAEFETHQSDYIPIYEMRIQTKYQGPGIYRKI